MRLRSGRAAHATPLARSAGLQRLQRRGGTGTGM